VSFLLPVTEAEAAAASQKPKQARTLRLRTPRRRQQPPAVRHPFDTRFGDAAGELEESKTMSLSNLRQLLMGSFCSGRRRRADGPLSKKHTFQYKPESFIESLPISEAGA
jgi:hypothetical protein